MTMASKAGKVIGVEVVPEAIEDAKANAVRNGVKNIRNLSAAIRLRSVRCSESGRASDGLSWWTRPERGCSLPVLGTLVELRLGRSFMFPATQPLARRSEAFSKGGLLPANAGTSRFIPKNRPCGDSGIAGKS